MKEATEKQHKTHKMTLDVMSGFRIFWGMILGALSLALILAIPTIVIVIMLYASGSV